MKNRIVVFLLLSLTIASCKGQSQSSKKHNKIAYFTIGKTVTTLGNNLWCVFQDSKSNYWFGSDGEGVFFFDGKTILNITEENGLSNNRIRQIQEDKTGNIYFSTLSGISKYDGKVITTLKPIESRDWKLEKNDLWFNLLGKSDENGPYRYDGKKLYHYEFPKHYLHDSFIKQGINPFFKPYEVYYTYQDRKGAMWFGTSVFGLCRFDGKSIKWMYEKDLTIVPAGGSFGIRSIYEDTAGKFWICNTLHQYLFDSDSTAKSDRLVYKKLKGIGDAKIFGGDDHIYFSKVIEDDAGHLWFTTWDQGVYKYDGATITHYPVLNKGKIVNLVSMYKDKKGVLWLGSNTEGAYQFNGKAFERFMP